MRARAGTDYGVPAPSVHAANLLLEMFERYGVFLWVKPSKANLNRSSYLKNESKFYCGCMLLYNNALGVSSIYLFRECCSRCVDSSHMTAPSSASWSRFSPPSNFVDGHVSTMWFMICRWPQEGDWARPNLCKLARHGPWALDLSGNGWSETTYDDGDRNLAVRAYSVPRTNCALRIKKCALRISSGIYFLSTG